MKTRYASLALLGLLGCGWSHLQARAAGSHDRPNVLVIVSDDQGYGDLSCFGNQHLPTPNLDRLKSESVWLERFYVAPLCAPTRAGLMTGRYQYRTGVWDTWSGQSNMAADERTLAEYFDDAGYATGHFSKWHMGSNYPFRPPDQGFATSVDCFFPLYKDRLNPRFSMNGVFGEPRGRFVDDFIADEAIKFMAKPREKPFLAYVAFFMPHYYPDKQVPDEYVRPFHADAELLPGDREVYGMVSNLDQNVGRLLAALRAQGLEENTALLLPRQPRRVPAPCVTITACAAARAPSTRAVSACRPLCAGREYWFQDGCLPRWRCKTCSRRCWRRSRHRLRQPLSMAGASGPRSLSRRLRSSHGTFSSSRHHKRRRRTRSRSKTPVSSVPGTNCSFRVRPTPRNSTTCSRTAAKPATSPANSRNAWRK